MNAVKKENGFTLIEVIVSFIVITLGVIALSRVTIFSLHFTKNCQNRFLLTQSFLNWQNTLLAKSFEAEELTSGLHSLAQNGLKISWQVTEISATLKKIELKVADHNIQKKGYFYKSKILNYKLYGGEK